MRHNTPPTKQQRVAARIHVKGKQIAHGPPSKAIGKPACRGPAGGRGAWLWTRPEHQGPISNVAVSHQRFAGNPSIRRSMGVLHTKIGSCYLRTRRGVTLRLGQ